MILNNGRSFYKQSFISLSLLESSSESLLCTFDDTVLHPFTYISMELIFETVTKKYRKTRSSTKTALCIIFGV